MSPKNDEEHTHMKNVPYLEAVGSVMYLAMTTQPNIAYAMGKLARFGSNPRPEHWHAVKYLLSYLQGTMNNALTYCPDHASRKVFMKFSDANHRGCKDSC